MRLTVDTAEDGQQTQRQINRKYPNTRTEKTESKEQIIRNSRNTNALMYM